MREQIERFWKKAEKHLDENGSVRIEFYYKDGYEKKTGVVDIPVKSQIKVMLDYDLGELENNVYLMMENGEAIHINKITRINGILTNNDKEMELK